MCIFDISLHLCIWNTWIFINIQMPLPVKHVQTQQWQRSFTGCYSKLMEQCKPLVALTILSRYTLGYRSWKPHYGGNWNLQRFNWFPLRSVLSGHCYMFVTAVDIYTVTLFLSLCCTFKQGKILSPLLFLPAESLTKMYEAIHAFSFLNIWPVFISFVLPTERFLETGKKKCKKTQLDSSLRQ